MVEDLLHYVLRDVPPLPPGRRRVAEPVWSKSVPVLARSRHQVIDRRIRPRLPPRFREQIKLQYLALISRHATKSRLSVWPGSTQRHNGESRERTKPTN